MKTLPRPSSTTLSLVRRNGFELFSSMTMLAPSRFQVLILQPTKRLTTPKKMLFSISQSDPQRAAFVIPAIDALKVAAEVVQKQETELARVERKDWEEYEKRLSEYRSLLDKNAEEPEFQAFFEKNPVFLESEVKRFFTKKSLGGERRPDFFIVLHDLSHLIVEIKKPALRLFNQNGDPRAELTHAQQQVRDYLKWAVEDKE